MDVVATQGQLKDFLAMLSENADLREVLEDPSIPEPQKLKVLDLICEKAGLSRPVRNFIALVTRNQRLHELHEMVDAYERISDQAAQVAEASIVSAYPLDAEMRRLLERQIARLTGGQQVRATYSEDRSLLGGACVTIGSQVYDGSVRTQLQRLKQQLVTAGLN